jgi:hypothetical protein
MLDWQPVVLFEPNQRIKNESSLTSAWNGLLAVGFAFEAFAISSVVVLPQCFRWVHLGIFAPPYWVRRLGLARR